LVDEKARAIGSLPMENIKGIKEILIEGIREIDSRPCAGKTIQHTF